MSEVGEKEELVGDWTRSWFEVKEGAVEVVRDS